MSLPSRKRNRLLRFNYSAPGYYFVTICTKNRIEYFGKIKNRKVVLNRFGNVVKLCWLDLPYHYWNCILDEFIVMPNHIHGIIVINNNVGNGLKPFPTDKIYSLSEIIRGLKTFSSRRINVLIEYSKFSWQKSFYDHIIRNEQSLQKIREYIRYNPLKWYEDPENPHRNYQ